MGSPHKTKGLEAKPTDWLPASLLARTISLAFAFRTIRVETIKSRWLRLRIEPADSKPPGISGRARSDVGMSNVNTLCGAKAAPVGQSKRSKRNRQA